jgi:hypothetical protein
VKSPPQSGPGLVWSHAPGILGGMVVESDGRVLESWGAFDARLGGDLAKLMPVLGALDVLMRGISIKRVHFEGRGHVIAAPQGGGRMAYLLFDESADPDLVHYALTG